MNTWKLPVIDGRAALYIAQVCFDEASSTGSSASHKMTGRWPYWIFSVISSSIKGLHPNHWQAFTIRKAVYNSAISIERVRSYLAPMAPFFKNSTTQSEELRRLWRWTILYWDGRYVPRYRAALLESRSTKYAFSGKLSHSVLGQCSVVEGGFLSYIVQPMSTEYQSGTSSKVRKSNKDRNLFMRFVIRRRTVS